MSTLHVTCSDDQSRFLIYAGSPGGQDTVHNTVKRWPGWRRLRAAGKIPDLPGAVGVGAPCSIYSAPVSPVSAAKLAGYTGRLAWHPEAHGLCKHVLLKLESAQAALRNGAKLEASWPTERRPFPHQAAAMLAASHMGPSLLIADDMGLGKTMTALWIAWESSTPRTLVICESSTKWKWQREIAATLGDVWCEVISGGSRQRADSFAALRAQKVAIDLNKKDPSYAIINYDLLPGLPDEHLTILAHWCEGATLILDESYRVKNRKSKTFNAVKIIAEDSAARILLTGTPVRNRVDDLWAQVELMRPGTWTSYSDFCNRHLDMAKIQIGKRQVFQPAGSKNLPELNAVMNTLQIRRKKEEVLDLPPKMHSYPELELDGPHLKLYKAMREWAILQLDALADETNVFSPQAQGATEAALRCAQIAMGFVGGVPEPVMEKASSVVGKYAHKIKGRARELVFPESPKLQWLIETIECLWEQGSRPVVFSRFNGPLVWLRHRFERESFVLHGGQSAETKDEVVERFQAGERSLFLCQVRIAAGFDLTSSSDELFLSRDWSPAINAQAEDRCHRIGQKGTVNIQIPIVTNTIEGYMHKKLEAKAGDAEAALQRMTIGELKDAL